MAKRMMVISLIVLGIAVFLVAGFFLVLFLAPGFQAFGLMYVTKGARMYNSGEVRILDEMEKLGYDSFSGSITLEVDECPVYVEFSQKYDYIVEYHEDFSGLTKTNIDYPSLKIERDNLGGAVIKITGFKKWVFENANTKRYVKLLIPISSVNNLVGSYRTNLSIISEKSDIEFSRELKEIDDRIPVFNNITIETNGKITSDSLIKATTYNYTTDNSIIISADDAKTINASNYNLKSKGGRVTVEKAISGNLTAETKNYDIKLVSCVNLTAKSEYGSIKCFTEGKRIQVAGMVNIETKAGSVKLGVVNGAANNKITTSSGSVDIQKMKNGSVTTKRGNIRIDSVNDVKIRSNMGKVVIEEVLTKIDVKTKRGNITLGGDGMVVNNPKVESTLGRVNLLSASKTVHITTVKNNVTFTNKDSENITIECGGKLVAKNLTGLVDITVGKKSTIEFTKITDTTTIKGGENCKELVVKALENSKDDTRYVMQGKSVTRYVDNDNGTGTFSKMETSSDLTNTNQGIGPYLKIEAKSAEVSVYLKLAPSEEQ